MNVYQISFTRKNGSTGSDRITAPNEEKAQRDFKRVYRPGDLDITGITLVESNVPATKQQERDALWEIRKIVEELGPSSYVGTAFQGCFEDAMDNIENDFASSYYTRWATEKRRADGLEEEVSDLRPVRQRSERHRDFRPAVPAGGSPEGPGNRPQGALHHGQPSGGRRGPCGYSRTGDHPAQGQTV